MLFVLVVIAVAVGLACVILLLIAAFCLLKQRRKDKKDLENELGSLEDRLSPVKRIRSNPKIQRHHSRTVNGIMIGTKWPKTPPIVYKPTNSTRLEATNPLDTSLLKPLPSFSRPNDCLSVPASSGVSRTSTHSGKTVSIYSTDSAPPHFHDHLSDPLFMSRVVLPSITRANLPKGMNLPSTVTRDIGLFIRPLPHSPGTLDLPSNSDSIRLRGDAYARPSSGGPNSHFDPVTVKSSATRARPFPHSARFASLEQRSRSQLLYRVVNPQALKETASTSSFPPPLW